MPNSDLKVTIITVVKNGSSTINRCLLSVANQTYQHLEVIVVDGNSTDDTLSIIHALNLKNMHACSSQDRGIYDALNKGLSLSTGDIVGLLHGDDYLKDEHVIASIVQSFKESNVPILIGRLAYFKQDNPRKIVRQYFPFDFKKWMFRLGMAPPHPSFYVKRELFTTYGNYRIDLEIAGDFDLMLRFLYFHRIPYKCIDDLWVMMSLGGKSTSGLKSIIKNNKDILKSSRSHNFYTNYLFIYSKYFVKMLGLVIK